MCCVYPVDPGGVQVRSYLQVSEGVEQETQGEAGLVEQGLCLGDAA